MDPSYRDMIGDSFKSVPPEETKEQGEDRLNALPPEVLQNILAFVVDPNADISKNPTLTVNKNLSENTIRLLDNNNKNDINSFKKLIKTNLSENINLDNYPNLKKFLTESPDENFPGLLGQDNLRAIKNSIKQESEIFAKALAELPYDELQKLQANIKKEQIPKSFAKVFESAKDIKIYNLIVNPNEGPFVNPFLIRISYTISYDEFQRLNISYEDILKVSEKFIDENKDDEAFAMLQKTMDVMDTDSFKLRDEQIIKLVQKSLLSKNFEKAVLYTGIIGSENLCNSTWNLVVQTALKSIEKDKLIQIVNASTGWKKNEWLADLNNR